ncbi:MAG: general secretion pathway protein GspK [Planctomycetes bacterium]|nr:general secretion pathway protein GspK [Planctomycetota bacterium]
MIRRTTGRNGIERRRKGVVLLAVLIVLVLLSLAAYQYSDLMTAEFKASDNYHKTAQARSFADSGISYAAALLSNADNFANNLNNNPFDNEEAFKEIAVGSDDGGPRGYFTLIAPVDPNSSDSSTNVRYGVVDETGKININAMMKLDPTGQQLLNMLMKLPNMTDDIANSIVYWADTAKKQRSGAADDYYSGLTPSYRARGGPLDSVDELLLVRGVTPQLLYGNDLNRNGILDPEEDDGSGTFDRGWAAFLTVHSREQVLDPQGKAPANINGDLQTVYTAIQGAASDDMAKFVALYRQYGATNTQAVTLAFARARASQQSSSSSQTGGFVVLGTQLSGGNSSQTVPGNLSSFTPDFTKDAKNQINSMFDLISAKVTVPGKTQNDPSTVYTSPLADMSQARDLLPKLFNAATVLAESEIPARVNVNTAAREVIAALPELTEADVQSVMALQPKPANGDLANPTFQTPAWLYTDANVKAATLSKLEKYITTRSQVYRVQALGYFDNGQGPAARVEAVIDTNGGQPRILAYRDLSDLGKGTPR